MMRRMRARSNDATTAARDAERRVQSGYGIQASIRNEQNSSEDRSVKSLLGQKFRIDYYQRDYKWERKQVRELIEDLTRACSH